jgi:signal transduction histidine kinase
MAVNCVGERIQLTVHDSGPGISEESLPHIFERFYRGDRSRSRSEGGSGLGLAIARQLAQAHGGELTATNHPQGGAIFTLTLP